MIRVNERRTAFGYLIGRFNNRSHLCEPQATQDLTLSFRPPDQRHHHAQTGGKRFQEVGAEIEERQHSKIGVKLKGHTVAFHHAEHDFLKQEVQ